VQATSKGGGRHSHFGLLRRSREVRHLGSDLFEPSGSAAVAEPSNFQLVAAFQIEAFRASSGVAISRPRPSTILRASCTSIKDYVTPEQIADQILCMCSPRGKTISGQAISIRGDTQMLG
jgi:hypothetical protein